MTQRIHISVPSSDLEASVAFYSELFGVEPSKLKADYANFRLDVPPIHLAIVTDPETAKRGADRHHFGVEVPDHATLEAWASRLEASGLPSRREANEACCYARADKAWFQDPDGHAWELWVRTGEADQLQSSSATCCT